SSCRPRPTGGFGSRRSVSVRERPPEALHELLEVVLAVELRGDDALDERGAFGYAVDLAGLNDDRGHLKSYRTECAGTNGGCCGASRQRQQVQRQQTIRAMPRYFTSILWTFQRFPCFGRSARSEERRVGRDGG